MKKILIKCKRCGHMYTVDEQLLIDQSERIKNAKQSRLDGAFANMSTGFNMYNDPEYQRNEMLIKRELLDAQNMTTCPSCGCHEYIDCTKSEVDNYNKNMRDQRAEAEKQAKIMANEAKEKAKRDAAFATPINPNAKVEDLIDRIVGFIEDKEWYMAEHYIEHCLDMDSKNYYLYYLKLLVKYRVSNDKEIIKNKIVFDEDDKDYTKLMKYADDNFKEKIIKTSFDVIVKEALDRADDMLLQEADEKLQKLNEIAAKNMDNNTCKIICTKMLNKLTRSDIDVDELARYILTPSSYFINIFLQDKDFNNRIIDILKNAYKNKDFKNLYSLNQNIAYISQMQKLKNVEQIINLLEEKKDKYINSKLNIIKKDLVCKDIESARKLYIAILDLQNECKDEKNEKFDTIKKDIDVIKKQNEQFIEAETQRIAKEKEEAEAKRKESERVAREKRKKIIKFAILSAILLTVIISLVCVVTLYIIPANRYNKGIKMFNEGKYDEAYKCFNINKKFWNSEGWALDSKLKIAETLFNNKEYIKSAELYKELNDYKECNNNLRMVAIALYDSGDWKNAIGYFEYLNDETYVSHCKCAEAEELILNKKYDEAYKLMMEMTAPQDINTIKKKFTIDIIDYIDVAKSYNPDVDENTCIIEKVPSVFFGSIYGDPVEWVVLEKRNNKALLLSKYVIDVMCFHNKDDKDIFWGNSQIREWLNNYFYDYCFSSTDKIKISITSCDNKCYENYESTEDKIFLMSENEYDNYLPGNKFKKTKPTLYADRHNVAKWKSGPFDGNVPNECFYWSRDKCGKSYARVYIFGERNSRNFREKEIGVRPAIWVQYKGELSDGNSAQLGIKANYCDSSVFKNSFPKSKLSNIEGMYIADIDRDSPLQDLGLDLKKFNLIVKVDDKKIRSAQEFKDLLKEKKADDNIRLTIIVYDKDTDSYNEREYNIKLK